jgi:hypothetical protein
MASTNKTEHLGLNQWVGTDPVLMEDFNRDNTILDGKVGTLYAERGWIKLGAVALPNGGRQLSFDLRNANLTELSGLAVVLLGVGNSSSDSISLALNGSLGKFNASKNKTCQLVFYFWDPGQSGAVSIYRMNIAPSSNASAALIDTGVPLTGINSIDLICDADMVAGARMLVYGIR